MDRRNDILEQVRNAVENGTPLAIRGGNTKSFYGGPAEGQPLDRLGLARIGTARNSHHRVLSALLDLWMEHGLQGQVRIDRQTRSALTSNRGQRISG